MLHGVSCNVYNPTITKKSVDWAWKFIKQLTERMLYMADSYVYENVFDEKCQKAIRYIRQAGGIISHSKLLYRSHESAEMLEKVIKTLTERDIIEIKWRHTKTKSMKEYKLLE